MSLGIAERPFSRMGLMTIQTKDYAKAGQTLYSVQWIWDDHEDPWAFYGDRSDFPTLAEAQAWAQRTMPTEPHVGSLVGPVGDWRANIDRGTWIADEFDDDEYGTILDAAWERDENFAGFGYIIDGAVEWDVDDVRDRVCDA